MRSQSLSIQVGTILLILIAFVDGILVGQKMQITPITEAEPQSTLEDFFPELRQDSPSELPEETATSTEEEPQKSGILKVPFIVQAPLGIWESPWNDYAEEASVLMVMKWVKGESTQSARADANELLEIGEWEGLMWGHSKLTTLEQTAQIFTDFFQYKEVTLVQNPELSFLKANLDGTKLILAPVNGQILQNPNYSDPAPKNHTILLTGYDAAKNEFIVNDPGTSRGDSWKVPAEILFLSLEDLDKSPRVLTINKTSL